jgi:hypothetical protein
MRCALALTLVLTCGCGSDDSSATGSGGSSGNGGSGGGSGGTAGSGGAAGSGGVAGNSGVGGGGGATAFAVSELLASIGVCTHIGQGVDDADESATALAYAGIKNVRDDGNPNAVDDWITLYQNAGVKTCLLTNHDIQSTLDMAKQLHAADALLAVEGPNEPNNFPVTYQGQTSDFDGSFLPVANFQRDLYAAVKADPELDGIPVFHSSEAGGAEPDNVGLQFLTIPDGASTLMPDGTEYADYANTHNYVCGHSNELVDNTAWNATDPTLNGDWDGLYVEYGHTWHGGFDGYSNADLETLPRVSTETGWLTSGDGSITEEQQARVFLNLYLSGFARGWRYTFVYMLRDDPIQGYWGLFDVDYQPKTSGIYLHNLTSILADPAPNDSPGQLNYTLADPPATVHDLLLQKSNGSFELVVWNDRPGGGSDDVTVTFTNTFPTARIYDPTTGTSPTEELTNVTQIPLTLTDHPVIIEIP